MKNPTLAILILLTLSCTTTPKDGVVTCEKSSKGEVKISEVCKLGEEIEFISDVNFFDIIDDNLFVAATAQQVYLYDMSGKQLSKIGSQGRARGEYLAPSMIASHNGNIFVGPINSQMIYEYNQQGEFIGEYKIEQREKSGYCFMRVSDKYIFMYSPMGNGVNGATNHYVDVFDKVSCERVAQMSPYDDIDKAFSLSMISNGMVCADDQEVIILKFSDLTLNKYKTATGEKEQLFDIDSPSYKLDTSIKYDEITKPTAVEKYIDFLENSSSPMCAGLHNNKLYVVTNESVTGGSRFEEVEYQRHLLTIDIKQGRGDYRAIEFTSGIFDKTYQFHDGKIYSLTLIDGEYYIREMDI